MMKYFLLFTIISCATLPNSRNEISTWLQKPLDQQLNPFKSDGCSSFPEGTNNDKNLWLRCCIVHDIAYWQGGTKKIKDQADLNLQQCVKSKNQEFISQLMHIGVSIGGTPRLKTSYRWGYGWNYTRGYLKISNIEKSYILKISPKKGENLIKYLDKSQINSKIAKLPKKIIY